MDTGTVWPLGYRFHTTDFPLLLAMVEGRPVSSSYLIIPKKFLQLRVCTIPNKIAPRTFAYWALPQE